MRIYAICPNCAEVRLAHLDCPRCDSAPSPRRPAPAPPAARSEAIEEAPPDGAADRARMMRVSAIVVGAYVCAVLALLVAAFARV